MKYRTEYYYQSEATLAVASPWMGDQFCKNPYLYPPSFISENNKLLVLVVIRIRITVERESTAQKKIRFLRHYWGLRNYWGTLVPQ